MGHWPPRVSRAAAAGTDRQTVATDRTGFGDGARRSGLHPDRRKLAAPPECAHMNASGGRRWFGAALAAGVLYTLVSIATAMLAGSAPTVPMRTFWRLS